MFDPRDIGDDSRQPGAVDPRENSRRGKMREGHRREYTPSRNRESFERRTARALAEVGMYRSVSFRDLWPRLILTATPTQPAARWIVW